MKVALLSKHRDGIHGIPRYAEELNDRLGSAHLYRYNASETCHPEQSTDWAIPNIPFGDILGKSIYTPMKLRSVEADVYHAIDPTETPPLSVANRKPIVATIHDLIVYRNPVDFNWSSLYLSRIYLWFVKYFADQIIAISESTKQDAIDILGIPSERITVVNHGVDSRFEPIPTDEIDDKVERPCILMVGVAQPRKNIGGVVRALGHLHESGLKAHLYLAGGKTEHLQEVKNIAESNSVEEYVHVLGRVSDNRLVELYNLADVLAMPSFYEGFGFPVIEAMACGTPVVTSDRSSLPDVGGDVPLYVNPDDVDSIAKSLSKVLNEDDIAEEMSQKGLDRAANFDWAKTAQQTREVYQKAIKGQDR